MHKNKKFFQ